MTYVNVDGLIIKYENEAKEAVLQEWSKGYTAALERVTKDLRELQTQGINIIKCGECQSFRGGACSNPLVGRYCMPRKPDDFCAYGITEAEFNAQVQLVNNRYKQYIEEHPDEANNQVAAIEKVLEKMYADISKGAQHERPGYNPKMLDHLLPAWPEHHRLP